MAALSKDSALLSALPSLLLAGGIMLPYSHELSNPVSADITQLHIISSALLKPLFSCPVSLFTCDSYTFFLCHTDT